VLSENYDPQEIGKRIKRLRTAKELTVQQLALRSKVSAGYISEVERGLSAVSVNKLMLIACGLETSIDSLIAPASEDSLSPTEVIIPSALSEAAERLHLSYRATLTLLQGRRSLTARRSISQHDEWNVEQWVQFYEQVKDYLPGQ